MRDEDGSRGGAKSAEEEVPGGGDAAPVPRPPTARGAATFAGRVDTGELPEKYRNFFDLVEESLRTERYAYRTEQTYLEWVKRFLIFAGPRTRRELKWEDAKGYLNYLTVVRRVSSGTQNQALSALQFLYGKVLKRAAGGKRELERAPQTRRVPTVLTREEIGRLLGLMDGHPDSAGAARAQRCFDDDDLHARAGARGAGGGVAAGLDVFLTPVEIPRPSGLIFRRKAALSSRTLSHTISLFCLDHWLEANATWHRHPADVLSLFISKRWYQGIALGLPPCPAPKSLRHKIQLFQRTGISQGVAMGWYILPRWGTAH